MRIRERPQRRLEADGPNRARQFPGGFEAVSIHEGNVGADPGVLGDVPLEPVGHFDFEVRRGDVVEQLFALGVCAVDDCDHLQQLVEWDRDGRGFDVAGNHAPAPCFTQSTR